MAGPLKTLVTALAASSAFAAAGIASTAVGFGEEAINDNSAPTPRVVVVPTTGVYSGPADQVYTVDPNFEMLFGVARQLDVYCFGFSTDVGAQPIDHADATGDVLQAVLQALQEQRVKYDPTGTTRTVGIWFKPVSERWVQAGVERYGRALVLTVQVDVVYVTPDPASAEATIVAVTLNSDIT